MPNRSKRDISETYFVIIIYHNLQRFECFILKIEFKHYLSY